MTQREALEILKTGRNVFLTGAAGSGKTHTLREYIKYLKELNAEVAITASTGIAATHMGGMTIHSWSGLGIRDFLTARDLEEIVEKSYLRNRIKNTAVLVVDEVSMLHHSRLDMLDMILKSIRDSHEPFGGIQVILCGDFFQLPPIQRRKNEVENLTFDVEEISDKSNFAYHSPAWRNLGLKICYLTEQHRQDDEEYLKVLNAIRENNVEEEIIEILNSKKNNREGLEALKGATKLYSHNVDVDAENKKELEKIPTQVFQYEMVSHGNKNLVETLKKSCLAPETLYLKVGAKVMFVKNNFEAGYVNGTLGIVDRLDKDTIIVRVLSGTKIKVERESWRVEEDGKVKAELSQYPLRLAWAITVHKSQGMSLDAAEIDLSNCFELGMGYVALSRVRSLEGLFLKGFNDIALRVSEEVLEFDDDFRDESEKNATELQTRKDEILDLQKEFKDKIWREDDDLAPELDTYDITREYIVEGKTVKEIAKLRSLKEGTIFDHLEKIKAEDPSFNIYSLRESIPKSKFQKIYAGFQKLGTSEGGKRPLTPVMELLGNKYSYEDLRLVRLFL